MKKGLGVLFVTSLLVSMFVSPDTVPSQNSPASAQITASRIANASRRQEIELPRTAGCTTKSDILCQDCSELCTAKDLFDTIGSFFGPGLENEPEIKKHWGVPQKARAKLRFVIATVADPAHTHLGLFFDRQIDAIREAVQTDRYLFSRAYMPWDTKDHPEDADVRVRLLQNTYQGGKEGLPGLMIFHGMPENGKTEIRRDLFVFVVGETPTGGINRSQFHMAVKAIQDICWGEPACKPSATTGSLFILGPTFSGSLYSLANILGDEVKGSFSSVLVHSGSASSYETIGWFTLFSAKMEKQEKLQIGFRTFQESSDYSVAHLLSLVCEQGYAAREVAVLSEDETAYGNVPGGKSESHEKTDEASTCQQADLNKCAGEHSGGPNVCAQPSDVVHLYFPRDIAQLRSAYQRDLQAQNSANSGKTLPLNLEDTGNDDDSVQIYSRGQTPLSQEAVMMGIVTNLSKHHVNFIVLEATNPLDALFLIRYLRAAYSEGRIVAIDTDLLLPREVNDSSLQGVMQISSYSLIPGVGDEAARLVEAPNSAAHVDRVFPSNYSAGTFNALLALLTIQDSGGQPGRPCAPPRSPTYAVGKTGVPPPCADLPKAAYAEYGWPSLAGPPETIWCSLAPPLWLTVLGRNGYWPVALLDTFQNALGPPSEIHAVQGAACLTPLSKHPPEPWRLLCCFIIGLVLIYISLVWWSSIESPSRVGANFAPIDAPWRNFLLFAADLVIFSTLLSLFWPWVRWRASFNDTPFGLLLLAVLIGVFLVFPADLKGRGAPILASLFRIAALVLSALAFYAFTSGTDPVVMNFRLHRYVHIASGVSPLMPFLLLSAASLWWCWYTLAGLMLWDQRGIEFLPTCADLLQVKGDSVEEPPSRARLHALTLERNAALLEGLRPTGAFSRVMLPAIITISLSIVVIGVHHPVRSLEGSRYDVVYGLCVVFAAFVMLCELFRLLVVWLEVRRLLIAFERLPLRRAFQRMKGSTTGALWRLGGSAFEDFFPIVAREFEALVRLKNSSPHDSELKQVLKSTDDVHEQLGVWVQQLQQKTPDAKSNAQTGNAKSRIHSACLAVRSFFSRTGIEASKSGKAMISSLQVQLSSTCAATLRYLNAAWDREAAPVLPDHDDCEQNKSMGSEIPAPTRFAEDFVCLFYFNFLASVFMRMRTLVMTVAGIYVLMLLSFSCYPFEPKAAFHTLIILLFILILGLVGFVFAQMHRDATLSRITNTKPGELGLDFWIRLVSFAAVPLFSLLTAQFPGISGVLLSWMQPALQALK
jgi:hypothetical protein